MIHTPLNIDREQIIAKLWELANLTPDTTKGNVTGQLKALDLLLALLPLTPNKAANKPLPAPEIYRSAWMAGARRLN